MSNSLESITLSRTNQNPDSMTAGVDSRVIRVPDWMMENQPYSPKKDRDGFIVKSLMRIMALLLDFRINAGVKEARFSTRAKLIFTLVVIILECTATNMFFVYWAFAVMLIFLAMLPGSIIKKILKNSIPAAFISMLIVLPAFLLGNYHIMVTVVLRVFISVTFIGILSSTSPWNEVTGSLKVFHLPDIFILTFDLTLKFIMILGDICANMITAIKLRSVGRNNRKESALSGVLGTTFLKSHQMSDEVYSAMLCRGFDGTYKRQLHSYKKEDLILAIILVTLIGLYVYLDFLIK